VTEKLQGGGRVGKKKNQHQDMKNKKVAGSEEAPVIGDLKRFESSSAAT